MKSFSKTIPVIEALYVDQNKVIIKLEDQDIPIVLIHSRTEWGKTHYFSGVNNEDLGPIFDQSGMMKGILHNSPDFGWYATLIDTTLKIFTQAPVSMVDDELDPIELKRGELCGEPFGFLPMKRSADGMLVPVEQSE
jgi:hypothetical protein